MHISISSGAVYGLLNLLKGSIEVSAPHLTSPDNFALSSIATNFNFNT